MVIVSEKNEKGSLELVSKMENGRGKKGKKTASKWKMEQIWSSKWNCRITERYWFSREWNNQGIGIVFKIIIDEFEVIKVKNKRKYNWLTPF